MKPYTFEITKQEIRESILKDPELSKLMVEDTIILTEDTLENILMVVGFVPVVGSIADAVLLLRYAIKGEYLFAALMLICLVPAVGDFIAKPLIKVIRGIAPLLKTPGKFAGFLMKNPKVANLYKKAMGAIGNPSVDAFLKQVGKVSKKLEANLRKSLDDHKAVYKSLMDREKQIARNTMLKQNPASKLHTLKTASGKTVAPTKVAGVTKTIKHALLKNRLQNAGKLKSYWYKWRQNRIFRNYIVKTMMAGQLLHLGLKSITDVDNAIQDPKLAEQLLNDQEFSNVAYEAEQQAGSYGEQSSYQEPEYSGGYGYQPQQGGYFQEPSYTSGYGEQPQQERQWGGFPNMDEDSMIGFIKQMAQSFS